LENKIILEEKSILTTLASAVLRDATSHQCSCVVSNNVYAKFTAASSNRIEAI